MTRVEDVTRAGEFEAARDAGGAVVADFFTGACTICRKIEPMLAVVKGEAGEKLAVFRIDAEENPDLAIKYEVRGVPTLLLFHRGALIDRKVGFVTANDLRKWVAPFTG